MRCPSCAYENLADSRFCAQCGVPLGRSPARVPDLRAYTPRHLAEKILSHRSALHGERKQVTVFFADVKGSMDLAEQVDPEAWHRIMDRFFGILAEGVHRFEGTVNQFTGDGVMALFGAPIAHEDHAQRACHAALHLCEALGRYGRDLRRTEGLNFTVRMGINSGEVVVGSIGDDLRMDYTAQGHTVGLAQRMERLAEPGKVYLTEHTAALVAGYFNLEDLGSFTLKGVRDPLRVYELRGVGPLRTRLDVARRRGFSRFVGREEEAATLEAALARAIAGDGGVVAVLGEPGVGKSRLCYEFLQRCRVRGIPVYEAHGVAHGKSVPFLVVLELARSYFGIRESDGDQVAREKIAGKLLLLDRELEEILPVLFEFLGVPDPARPAPRMDPEARQRQLTAMAARLVPARSRREPAVFVVEDLHWVDGGSESFIAAHVDALPGTRTLLLVNFRPEYHATWALHPQSELLTLPPLGPAATAELLRDLLGGDPSLAGLADLLHERTRGNPFFIEEVVQALIEAGNLVGTRGAYRLAEPLETIATPASVQAVLASRVDRLPEREKGVLVTAAVIGKRFSETVLRRIVELAEDELADALHAHTQAEFVYSETLHAEPEYAFKHPLTQEVAYHAQLAERRARVHGAVARAVAELYADKLDERAALLAHHWDGAGEPLEAARWSRRAAEWVRASNLGEALRHWQNLRAFLARVPESGERTRLAIEGCVQLLELGWRFGISAEDSATLFAEGEALARGSGDLGALARLVNAYGVLRSHFGSAEDFVEAAREATRLAEQTDDAGLGLATGTRLVIALIAAGDLRQALALSEQELARPPATLKLGSDILGYSPFLRLINLHGKLLIDLGRLDEGAVELERVDRLAREEGDVETLGITHGESVVLARVRGDAEAALSHARETLRIAERLGSPFFRAGAYLAFGQAHILGAEWTAAREALERGLAIARTGGAYVEAEPLALAWLAAAHLGVNRTAEARAAAEEALEVARRRRTKPAECIAYIGWARVLLRTEGVRSRAAIEAALDRALALVEETGAMNNEPFIRVQRARLAAIADDREGWRRELEAARRLFSEMGAVPRAERLARELEFGTQVW